MYLKYIDFTFIIYGGHEMGYRRPVAENIKYL